MKKYNFNAGPSMLPREVVEATASAVLDYFPVIRFIPGTDFQVPHQFLELFIIHKLSLQVY